MGPILQYLSDHRTNSSEKTKSVTSTTWLQPSESEGDETDAGTEGNRISVLVNKYERNPKNRNICIRHYGAICKACDFDFSATYGDIGIGYIHVHHLHPLAVSDGKAKIPDPIKDLRPVCPNCHEMLHRGDPLHPKTIEQLKEIIEKVKDAGRPLHSPDSGA
jgi:5-methylcytosine-specific restriction protein A